MDWKKTSVSEERTHHLLDGQPLYSERFDEVLSFHEPGLAAVSRVGQAWHIRLDGTAAYAARFERTFGFYDGLAAVIDNEGWHHIVATGVPAYSHRFSWCGNFQERLCTVRDRSGGYMHIDLAGAAAYSERWPYAGDFRDGIAVVQGDDGRSTHIDKRGRQVHGRWFLDLDVFHKGLARARDDGGWTHVDHNGRPVYGRRFAAVELFYNGQARVECFDGGLEVIDEAGWSLVELRPALCSEFHVLSGDLVGFWKTETIATAVQLGVFEHLPATGEALAGSCRMPLDKARRLLRALQELQLVEREEGEEWAATQRGVLLQADHPLTLADAALEYAGPLRTRWLGLPEALRAPQWQPADVFAEVAADDRRREAHHRMLRSYAVNDYRAVVPLLELKGDERIVDAGGGTGALAELIQESHPGVDITVLDRPEGVAQLQAKKINGRPAGRGVDIFGSWGATSDVVILARVLHDWDDQLAGRVLANARRALVPHGRLLVVEMVLDEEVGAGGLCDLHLLCVTGGQERTESQFKALFHRAGFELAEVRRAATLPSVLVGVLR